MITRGRLLLGLILGVVMVERVAHFSASTSLPLALSAQGQPVGSVGEAFMLIQAVTVVGWILGGLAVYLSGPRRALAIGVGIAAVGHAAIALGASLVPGTLITALGSGVLAPCGVVAAAELLVWGESDAPPSPRDFTAVAAFVFASLCAANVGGFIAPLLVGSLWASSGRALLPLINVAAIVVALALALAAVWVGSAPPDAPPERPTAGPYRAPVPEATSPKSSAPLPWVGFAMLMAPVLAQSAAMAASSAISGLPSPGERFWLMLIQPAASAAASLVAFVLLLTAVRARSSLPPLFLYGVGALVFSIGATISAANVGRAVELFALSSVFLGAGAAASSVVPLAYAALALPGRAAAFVVVGWWVTERVASAVVRAVVIIDGARLPLLVIAALVNLGAGLLLIVGARSFHHERFGAS